MNLGALLLDAGLVTPSQLETAVEAQQRTGSRLGAILVAAGVVGRRDLYRTLAAQWGHDYVDLTTVRIDEELLGRHDPATLFREGWMPLHRDPDGRIVVATADEPTAVHIEHIEMAVGAPITVAVTTDWDLDEGLQRAYRDTLLDRAALGLWRRTAVQSARRVLLRGQLWALLAVLAVVVGAFVVAPGPTLVTLSMVVGTGFLVSVLFKFVVCLRGARLEHREAVTDEDVAALDDRDLPSFTVLVPVYREANIVADLIGNLGGLDYPKEKLEIVLLLEEDDAETIAAARAANPPATMKFLVVPDGQPKTKPKACNVGLFFARGDLVVIYDAEDKPDPDQLKKVVVAFERAGENTVCVQAALNYWNADDNVLTRMFTLEYSFWFDYMLPGLDDLNLPIPLGGTSNHFRTTALRELGGWDPFNVTEDADLGIRAAARGHRVAVVNSTTYEEANRAAGNWVRQRSRWIKGYLQTLLVHLRQPIRLVRTAGLRPTVAFLLLVGGTPATFLFTPPLYALFVASLVVPGEQLGRLFPGWVLWVSLANLLVGNALMIYVSMMGAFRRRRYPLVLWALLNPVYWLLHSIAAYKAVWQLVTRPHYWEKTTHGLSTVHSGEPVLAPADVG
jgi:cellulose synthase/poly-beta-1,6-N-acetylglucosamine synthase-like glycosyltransferase